MWAELVRPGASSEHVGRNLLIATHRLQGSAGNVAIRIFGSGSDRARQRWPQPKRHSRNEIEFNQKLFDGKGRS